VSDDTPTQRLNTPESAAEAIEEEGKKSRGLMIALIAIGALLLVALIILLIVLFGGNGKPVAVDTKSPTPTASDTPSQTPSASATPTTTPTPTPTTTTAPPPPPPPPSGPSLATFTTDHSTVKCDNKTGNPIILTFRWSGTNGSVVYIAVGATSDPKQNGQGWMLPTTGTQADFPYELDYGCYNAKVTYSLGIYDNSGHKSVKQLTITNTGDLHG
jgi:hypothetical protein